MRKFAKTGVKRKEKNERESNINIQRSQKREGEEEFRNLFFKYFFFNFDSKLLNLS